MGSFPVEASRDEAQPSMTSPHKETTQGKGERRQSRTEYSTGMNTPIILSIKRKNQGEGPSHEVGQKSYESTYGVQSLGDTISTADELDAKSQDELHDTQGSSLDPPRLNVQDSITSSIHDSHSSSGPSTRSSPNKSPSGRGNKDHVIPQSFASIGIESPATRSTPLSTPKTGSLRSFRLSDDELSADEAGSQAVTSSGEDEGEEDGPREADEQSRILHQQNAPQLVMPSIRMPSRRPFTEKGRNLGKLKIMVVGRKGKINRYPYTYIARSLLLVGNLSSWQVPRCR